MARIHITGASGSGTTTLGVAVASRLDVPHFDTDAFYWRKTDPPFTTKLPAAERVALLSRQLLPRSGWVLSGSALKWGEPLEPLYDLIVFLTLEADLRMERIRQRESRRYGRRIEAGGDMAETSGAFIAWAASYDGAGPDQRSRTAHEEWLAMQTAPVLRLDSSQPVSELASSVVQALQAKD